MRRGAKRRSALRFGLVLLAGCTAAPLRLQRDATGIPFDRIEHGSQNEPGLGRASTLIVEASGRVFYERVSDLDPPGIPEVGQYETALTAGEIERLKADLLAFGFGRLEARSASLQDGQGRLFGLVQAGIRYEDFDAKTQPQLARLDASLKPIIDRAIAHPRWAYRIRVPELVVGPDRRATVTVELSARAASVVPQARCTMRLQGPWPDEQGVPLAVEPIGVPPEAPPGGAPLDLPIPGTYRVRFDLRGAPVGTSLARVRCGITRRYGEIAGVLGAQGSVVVPSP